MAANETFLITGASGFIGGWLVETLRLSGAADVRAGIRRWSSAVRLARFPVDIVACDVLDPEQIAQAMDGVTHVIHCVSGSPEAIVQGTANALEVAHKLGIRRFIHLSTTEVYGEPSGEVDETYTLQSFGNPYGDAKIEAEKLCWQYHDKGLPVTVIRPTIVYGPFSGTWTVYLARRLQSGQWSIFEGRGEGVCNLVYVADLVTGILLAARSDQAVGEAFNLSGPETLSWNDYFRRFNAALGLPELATKPPSRARLRSTVMVPVRMTARVVRDNFEAPVKRVAQRFRPAKKLMQVLEQFIVTTPRLSELSLYNRQATYVTHKAQDVLGYRPRYDVDAGLDLTVQWLRHVGLADEHNQPEQ
ncbi:MAG: NAD(P)-dependent oxidoreductase [Anaerolineae bacterium]|nr:NAD(P)-dependent oxidoreductase [Anaerolineae bacterium]